MAQDCAADTFIDDSLQDEALDRSGTRELTCWGASHGAPTSPM